MQQSNIDDIFVLLTKSRPSSETGQLLDSIYNEKICFHNMGVFELEKIRNLIRDKIALKKLGLSYLKIEGLDLLYQALIGVNCNAIRQVRIINDKCGFTFFFDQALTIVIGHYIDYGINFNKDIELQMDLHSLGHPNKNVFIIEKGKLVGNLLH